MKQLRCLVVGNRALLARVVSDMLELLGHSVECVRSDQDAFSRLSGDRFDLVLIDGRERLEVARAIKDAAPSTRVILATGGPELSGRSLLANGVLVLYKPFSFEDLKRALADFNTAKPDAPCSMDG
jgi:CheY-like chemotaxis protein